MLNIDGAISVIKLHFPKATIPAAISYGDDYLFVVYRSYDRESLFDPFYAINRISGDLREFSMETDGDISEIMPLFRTANLIP